MKVAVLGTGMAGKGAIRQLLKFCPEVNAVAGYDISQARLDEIPEDARVTKTTCLEEILTDPEVRLVCVKSTNATHKELTLRALEAGKAVLCEKPIANSLADALEMVEFAEKRKLFFQIGFELRYSLLYMKIKEWIDAGLLGEIVNVDCLYSSSAYQKDAWRNTSATGGSTFSERLSHYVDLMRWWTGSEPAEVFSACSPKVVPYTEVRDNYHTTCRFQNGAVGHISYYMNYPATFKGDALQSKITDQQLGDGHALRYIIVGRKGAAETDVFHRKIKRWEFIDTPEVLRSDWVENLTWDPDDDYIYYHNGLDQIKDIVRRVAQGLPPKTPARDAYQTMRLCFAADEAADSGQIVSMLP